MKYVFAAILLASPLSFAQQSFNDSFANYDVPVTSPELLPLSHFAVEVIAPYTGNKTKNLSYIFPQQLTGHPPLQVDFENLSMDPKTKKSVWDSPFMTAECNEILKKFTCAITVKKENNISLINKKNVIDFLNQSGSDSATIQKQIEVLNSFLDSEPGGFLSYSISE